MELRHFIELNLRLKFKGCNHPTRRLLNRPQRQNTNPDFRLEPLESKQGLKSKERSLGSSLERRQVQRNKVNFRDNRSSSMTQLPTIRNSRNNTVREHRQRLVHFVYCVLFFLGGKVVHTISKETIFYQKTSLQTCIFAVNFEKMKIF